MSWLEALILGIIQGLTEFLPVSSSGHLELGKEILNIEAKENMLFTVVVHGATVLSTIVIFRKDILQLITGGIKFQYNTETKYILMILLSSLPVIIVGLLFKTELEGLFNQNIMFVGFMLLITGILLLFTYYASKKIKDLNYKNTFVIGIAQAVAVLPGISRSGSTISAGLLLGVDKEKIAKFSFLMVLIPIIGANFKSIIDGELTQAGTMGALPLIIGFLAAFTSGLLACTWMINIVKKGKLIYFSIYCFAIGTFAITYSLIFN